MTTLRRLAACLALSLLAACACTYSKDQLQPWMQCIESLRADQDLDRLPAARLAALLAPAFCDDVFVASFGTPYAELDDDQRERIRRSLVTHHPHLWVGFGLARPFDNGPAAADTRRLWEAHIARERGRTFASALAARAREREQAALARERARRRPRPPSVAELRRGIPASPQENTVDWEGLGKALGALVVAERERTAAADRRNAERDQQLAAAGKVETWNQRTAAQDVQKARRLMPYSFFYDFEGEAIFKLLETRPWNHGTRAIIQKKLDRVLFDEPPIRDDEWAKFRDAKKALWLILETPLPD